MGRRLRWKLWRHKGVDIVVTHVAFVSAVGMDEEIIVGTDNGLELRRGGAVDVAVFAEYITFAHFQERRLACVLQILSLGSNGAEREELVILTKGRRATNHYIAMQHTARIQLNMRPYHTIRPNLDIVCNLKGRVNNSCRMNLCHIPHLTPPNTRLQA